MADPANMLALAEAMLAKGSLPKPEPWIQDQHEAASAELRPLLHAMDAHIGAQRHKAGTSPRSIAFKLAVIESIGRRAKPSYRCEHSLGATPPPLIIDLGTGMIACQPCALALDLPIDEDGRCDLCDKSTVMFNPLWMELGPALVHSDICDSCRAWLAAED